MRLPTEDYQEDYHAAYLRDIQAWVETLSPKQAEQVKIIKDLLRHAQGDGMSDEDRNICLRVLQRLDYPAWKALQMGDDAKNAKVMRKKLIEESTVTRERALECQYISYLGDKSPHQFVEEGNVSPCKVQTIT